MSMNITQESEEMKGMNMPSTENTKGCSTEVKQPEIPKIKPLILNPK